MQKLLVLRLIFLYEPFIILESSYLKLIILKVTSHLSGLSCSWNRNVTASLN